MRVAYLYFMTAQPERVRAIPRRFTIMVALMYVDGEWLFLDDSRWLAWSIAECRLGGRRSPGGWVGSV